MKYIKNGKVILDGTYRECDLEEMLLKALEIIIDKRVDIWSVVASYKSLKGKAFRRYNGCCPPSEKLTKKEWDLILGLCL